MKLLFVTGGEKCECKDGIIESTLLTNMGPRTIREQCRCVKAMEATVEELVDHGVHKTIERSGSVVPKED